MGFTGQEKFYLLAVVRVQVAVAPSPDEVTSGVVGYLCNHHGQQGIAGDVKRHAEEDVGTHADLQLGSLDLARQDSSILDRYMSPCSLDYISVSIRRDPSHFESTWTLRYSFIRLFPWMLSLVVERSSTRKLRC